MSQETARWRANFLLVLFETNGVFIWVAVAMRVEITGDCGCERRIYIDRNEGEPIDESS